MTKTYTNKHTGVVVTVRADKIMDPSWELNTPKAAPKPKAKPTTRRKSRAKEG